MGRRSKRNRPGKAKARPLLPAALKAATPPSVGSGATLSRIPSDVLRLLRAQRLRDENDAPDKLARLRRLELQKVLHELPETRVEQSFNEQLFAAILGYRTLLSHDGGGQFHLLPKNAAGPNRFDDFSLGFFGRTNPLVTVRAEFKSPGHDLDTPQHGRGYDGQSAVEQAFDTALRKEHCRWVIVSNFRELRLYGIDGTYLARTDLLHVRTREDLAVLCSHFDRMALLGAEEGESSGMSIALSELHPARGFEPLDHHHRSQWVFTPPDQTLPLHVLEKRLRAALESARLLPYFLPPRQFDEVAITVRAGFVVCEGKSKESKIDTRLAVSRTGQVAMSLREPTAPGPGHTYRYISLYDLQLAADFFARVVLGVLRDREAPGELEVVLRDVAGAQWRNEIRTAADAEIAGRWSPCPATVEGLASGLATAISELAIQFRDETGGVALQTDAIESKLRESLRAS